MKVRATDRGYYGGQIREPDTASAEFNLVARVDFSKKWMEAIGWNPGDPLDHDGDGKKGGSVPAGDKPLTERDIAKNEAIALGIEFAPNLKTEKLFELIAAKQAELAAGQSAPVPDPGALSDDDKILKALEISGRSDEMTVAEAEAIIAAASTDI